MKKYKIGKKIKSLKELSKQEFIYFKPSDYAKIINRGWWQNWQFITIEQYLSRDIYTKQFHKSGIKKN